MSPVTPLTGGRPKRSSDEAASAASVPRPLQEDRLKVFLRIRPLPDPRDRRPPVPAAKPPRKPKQLAKEAPVPGDGQLCLAPAGPSSVALTVPRPKLVDPKRPRIEVFDGFSGVFPSDSTQQDIFAQVMNPIVDDFLSGKSGLLVAMGPTGSGKTHTIFGSPRNPGILPLSLRKIFNAKGEEVARKPQRPFFLSMFEILSEGKGEHILDLLSDAVECVLQQSVIKGLQEVAVSNPADAESLISRGMIKRSTAATNANSNSSRSQCIITIRADSEHPLSSAVLTIADLAGAERERRTGNQQGLRLLESNFINNTSMVFSQCLRSLLKHQKNQKKPLEKHFKNSMLTRYLRDYLEGRKKMTLILNVKPGNDDYLDTTFLLRQASPYMKIKYTNLEGSSDLTIQKRINPSLICQENKKKRKIQNLANSEMPGISRSEAIMTNFARALLTVGRQYKNKLLESENAAASMNKLIRDKDIQIRDKDILIMELKKELVAVKYCSSKSSPINEDGSVNHDDSASSGQVSQSLVSVSSQPDLGSYDASEHNLHVEAQELTCLGPQNSSALCILKGESDSSDASCLSLIDEQICTRNRKVGLQVFHKELDRSESFTVPTPAHAGGPSYSGQSLTELELLIMMKDLKISELNARNEWLSQEAAKEIIVLERTVLDLETTVSALEEKKAELEEELQTRSRSSELEDATVAFAECSEQVTERRIRRRWSSEEEEALRDGVLKRGAGKWSLILHDNPDAFSGRTAVDLKDKWRNLMKEKKDT